MTHPDVLVIGGGIIGLACARELALLGLRVEIVERLPAGAEASVAAAGMISPVDEASVPGPFLDACLASRDLWGPWVAAIEEETGLSIDYDTSGALLVALDDAEEEALARTDRVARGLGEMVEEVEPEALRRWVPSLHPEVRRALLLPGDHRVDNVEMCAALTMAVQKLGVLVHHASEVQSIELRQEGTVLVQGNHWHKEARFLVVAAGAWSGLLPPLPALPLRPVRGQMLLLGGIDWPFKGSVRTGSSTYAVRRGETGLLVGSTLEEAGFDKHTTLGGVGELIAFARRLFPGLEARLESVWAGLRPGTPDDLPILGPLPGWPAVAATGHFRNGILLAPWTARQVGRMVASGERIPEIEAFSPSRFGLP
ncbi:MAG TPA: glycine oxidase ThiO [Thermoanaerobaculia bacterium]|nr:glycine oxidase ThiO [Thermoanaerobaculia bacterium]